ncbi:MAG: tRNA pseudouridine(38-40) synthase TruA [Clostridia bacterium]|nr:tRNA pseudouridine(38-40) synthase TruA [Clostridia bacterium]
MRNIKLTIEYDGTNFSCWQIQKYKRTIEEELETALAKILKEEVKVIGSGRTDAGVHAMGQVANFKTDKTIKPEELLYALNTMLPYDIVILNVEDVDESFNARISAKAKHYRYVINNAKFPSALNANREYHYKYFLDTEAMQLAANDLKGKHDFKAFMAVGSTVKDTEREIYDIQVARLGNRVIIDVVGNGFLYNMVRIIAGTLIDVGSGKLDICVIKNMIETGDRNLGGRTVAPEGLFLVNVTYQ